MGEGIPRGAGQLSTSPVSRPLAGERSGEVGVRDRPSRHLVYHELREALSEEGCALCRLRERSVERYLQGLLYESVNDPGVREKLRASRGFCPRHTWQVRRLGGPLGVSILWRDLLSQEALLTGGPTGRRRGASGEHVCPACAIASDAERRYLEELGEHLTTGDLRAEYEASAGLCLPHVRLLARGTEQGREYLLTVEREKVGRLREELSEIIRKHDYRFAAEPRGEEKDAWIRATRKLAGERVTE